VSRLSVETIRSPTLKEEVHRVVLPGGLPVYFCPKPEFRKRYACYSTFYGSVDNRFAAPGERQPSEVPDGIAHFLEHTLFETEEGNVSDLFARNGAHNNAYTSFSTTTYLFAAAERFYENLELLIRFVENPVFRPDKVEKEKGIIEQEIQRYRDDPSWVGYMGLLESLFVAHPLRIDIAGTAESIRRIDSETLHRCHRTFYHPRNMILFVIGELDRDQVFDFVAAKSRAGSAGAGGAPGSGWRIDRLYPAEPDAVARERFEKPMEVALPKLLIGYKETGVPLAGRELLMRELVNDFALDILFGRSSDAFTRLYVSELALDDFSAGYHTCAGVGFVAIGGETPNPEGLEAAVGGILDGVSSRGLDAAEFERHKRKFIGGFVRSFNSLEFIANHYTGYRFHGLDLFDVVDALERIRREEVLDRIRALASPGRRAVSLIRPRA
jgi:predicted Zn-dependent peptidase